MEGDFNCFFGNFRVHHFNPLPPHGGRRPDYQRIQTLQRFQSTPSAWRETGSWQFCRRTSSFQSTPSAWRETSAAASCCPSCRFQSTPSAWRETKIALSHPELQQYFNPLPPHGGRLRQDFSINFFDTFQSTPSAWRETFINPICVALGAFQSTPSAWRETMRPSPALPWYGYFNPLPPHGGRRKTRRSSSQSTPYFNPLPPHGGRPHILLCDLPPQPISIHSLRMEGDKTKFCAYCGAKIFQSTPSAWRETR